MIVTLHAGAAYPALLSLHIMFRADAADILLQGVKLQGCPRKTAAAVRLPASRQSEPVINTCIPPQNSDA